MGVNRHPGNFGLTMDLTTDYTRVADGNIQVTPSMWAAAQAAAQALLTRMEESREDEEEFLDEYTNIWKGPVQGKNYSAYFSLDWTFPNISVLI